jgi:hypothetical protein
MSAQTEPDPKQWAAAMRWLAHADEDFEVLRQRIDSLAPKA